MVGALEGFRLLSPTQLGLLPLVLKLFFVSGLLLCRDAFRVFKFRCCMCKPASGGLLRADSSAMCGSECKKTSAENTSTAENCRDRLRDPESPEKSANPDTTSSAVLTVVNATTPRRPTLRPRNLDEEEKIGVSSTREPPEGASAVVIQILCAAMVAAAPSPASNLPE